MGKHKTRAVGEIPGLELHLHPNVLKWIGLICVCFGFLSTAVIQLGILGLDPAAGDAVYDAIAASPALTAWANTAMALTMVSYLAIPIYAKLVYEGAMRTSEPRRYFLRLVLTALLAEVPYDLATTGMWFHMASQNPIWSLAIAALMLQLYRTHYQPGPRGSILQCLVMLMALAWTLVLRAQFGLLTVLLAASFFIFSAKKTVSSLCGGLMCFLQFPAPLGMFAVHWYDGNKGKPRKTLFYVLYLAQLLLFAAIALLMAR